ncbi:MAG: hypothetical protein ACREBE_27960 [bacterium]
MRGIALFTTLAMSFGTAAFASPVRVADRDDVRVQVRSNDPNGQWTRDRYDRYNGSHWSRDFRGRWMTLARAYTSQSDRQFIHVKGQRLTKLRIEGVRGAPLIQKIAIEFGDGSTQAVDLDMRLARGAGEVIDLNGGARRVDRIIVYADTRSRGSYSLYGATRG